MSCKKGLGKVNQIRNNPVICIRPGTGKLKTVAGLRLACSPFLMFLFRIPSGAVRIIFCMRTIRNNKNLNILIQTMSCPKRLPLVAVDLVKCLPYGNTTVLQFDMHKRQTINQYCNVITIIMFCAIVRTNRILIDNL